QMSSVEGVLRVIALAGAAPRTCPKETRMGQLTDRLYRALAKRDVHQEGYIEVDDNAVVSNGEDAGAYVQAWIWVDDPEDVDTFPPRLCVCGELEEAHQADVGSCLRSGCQAFREVPETDDVPADTYAPLALPRGLTEGEVLVRYRAWVTQQIETKRAFIEALNLRQSQP